MSFDVFENIFTASDPAGGRAIKVSALTGIDSAESIYTQTDPAGGRAIKVKIIAGGVSTGTLQIAGGLPISSTLRYVTDSSTSPVSSPLQISTTQVGIIGSFFTSGASSAFGSFISYRGNIGTGRDLAISCRISTPASSGSVLQNSPFLELEGSGYNGSSAVPGGFKMYTKVYGTGSSAPSFELQFENYSNATIATLNNNTFGLYTQAIAAYNGNGLKIGTDTAEKIGFWNKTPVVQPTTSVTAATVVHNAGGTAIKTDDTFGGYTLAQVVGALRLIGILA